MGRNLLDKLLVFNLDLVIHMGGRDMEIKALEIPGSLTDPLQHTEIKVLEIRVFPILGSITDPLQHTEIKDLNSITKSIKDLEIKDLAIRFRLILVFTHLHMEQISEIKDCTHILDQVTDQDLIAHIGHTITTTTTITTMMKMKTGQSLR